MQCHRIDKLLESFQKGAVCGCTRWLLALHHQSISDFLDTKDYSQKKLKCHKCLNERANQKDSLPSPYKIRSCFCRESPDPLCQSLNMQRWHTNNKLLNGFVAGLSGEGEQLILCTSSGRRSLFSRCWVAAWPIRNKLKVCLHVFLSLHQGINHCSQSMMSYESEVKRKWEREREEEMGCWCD